MSKTTTHRKSLLKLKNSALIPLLNLPKQPDPSNEIYASFLNILTISTIKAFSLKCKEYFFKQTSSIRKDLSLKRNIFISFLKSTFSSDEKYTLLYEQMQRRFSTLKCELKCQNKKLSNYFITNITSEDEINIYEFTCALICYVKCDYDNKLQLLFEITDKDDDGYINELELKKMIYTVNSLFSEEEKPININSTVMHQSLASIKSRKFYMLLMKHPGELSKIFSKNKYIDYSTFYNAITKIPQYRHDFFPFYINLKHSLLCDKTEESMSIKENIYNDFAVISKEIINEVKYANDIGKTYTDFKKNLEPLTTRSTSPYLNSINYDDNNNNNNNITTTNINNYTSNSNNNTINTTCSSTLFSKKMNSIHGLMLKGVSKTIIERGNTIQNTRNKFLKRNEHLTLFSPIKGRYCNKKRNSVEKEDTFVVNYNKINGMETFPKKVVIEEDSNGGLNTCRGYIKRKLILHTQNKIRNVSSKLRCNSMSNTSYMDFNQVMSEINVQIDKHKTQNQAHEELKRMNRKIEKLALKTRMKLKDSNPTEKKTFGKFTISTKSNTNT